MSEKWYPSKPETELEYYKHRCLDLEKKFPALKMSYLI